MDAQNQDTDVKALAAGSHRVCTAEQTLARFLPMKHHFGITRLANVTGLDRVGIPVVIAIRPNARSIAVSQGKGPTLARAKASALMEAIEIWHAERVMQPLHYGTARDLAVHHRIIDTARLPEVPRGSFSDTDRMVWVPGRDLMSGDAMLVPYEMVHADYTHPGHPGAGCFPCSTNGLASGNHPLEAICHAICEVVERDALSLWHARPAADQAARRVDLRTVDDPACREVIGQFVAAGLECGIWDVTADTGIATYLCLTRDTDPASGHPGLGSGTHMDRRVACMRALTEAAQTRLNYISGAREDLGAEEYDAAGMDAKTGAFDEMFAAGAGAGAWPFDRAPHVVNETLQGDLDWLLERLGAVGIADVAAVDLSREEFGVSVVRVIIPGLEAPHDDDSYVAGPRARAVAA